MSRTQRYVAFAEKYNVAPEDAFTLPVIFEYVAEKKSVSIDWLLHVAMQDGKLAFLITCWARDVASQARKEGI